MIAALTAMFTTTSAAATLVAIVNAWEDAYDAYWEVHQHSQIL